MTSPVLNDGSRIAGPILGIESSCDETSAAVVVKGWQVLSNVVHSQVDLHAPYGGVVPEIASRAHLEWLPSVIETAVARAGLPGLEAIEAVAATMGPGLAGALLVGFSAAKGLAMRLDRPLIAVNHIEAHMLSPLLSRGDPSGNNLSPRVVRPVGTEVAADQSARPETLTDSEVALPGSLATYPLDLAACLPALALVVSGGHTLLYRLDSIGCYRLLGRTIDDAAGEAFDKGAALLGLGYPGGPEIARLAEGVAPGCTRFPRGRPKSGNPALNGLNPACCWSFSGLKTALKVHLAGLPHVDRTQRAQIAADYQEAIVESLVMACDRALTDERALLVGGGVAHNQRLRTRLAEWSHQRKIQLCPASVDYCGDNAAMIAALAGMGRGLRGEAALSRDISPNLFDMG